MNNTERVESDAKLLLLFWSVGAKQLRSSQVDRSVLFVTSGRGIKIIYPILYIIRLNA